MPCCLLSHFRHRVSNSVKITEKFCVTNSGTCHPRGCRTPVSYEVGGAGGPLTYFTSLCVFNGGQHEEELTGDRTCNFNQNYRQIELK